MEIYPTQPVKNCSAGHPLGVPGRRGDTPGDTPRLEDSQPSPRVRLWCGSVSRKKLLKVKHGKTPLK